MNELKKEVIYDYQEKRNYSKLFTSLYDKKEAIDFLLSKDNIKDLYEKIEPTDRTITLEDIKDTEECIFVFNKLKNLKDNLKIFEYIKTQLSDDVISKFENYSKIYPSIIELDRNQNYSTNLYSEVHNIINNASFIFLQDKENFSFISIKNEYKTITVEKLIHLKNTIHMKSKNENKEINFDKEKNNENDKKETENDKIEKKCKELIFFKDVVSEIEIINEYMIVLRTKGSSLPIEIKIEIKYPKINYYLKDKATNFNNIANFLFKAKTDYISQLNTFYNENGTSLEEHYEKMSIKNCTDNIYKGLYIYESNSESMEKFIYVIFMEKTNNFPIAQNVLITNKETSPEEIQAFFHRAILCSFNVLFIVEINNPFSDYQLAIMNSYIDKLLTYKNEKYKEYKKKSVEKTKTKEYLDSCIIFVYDKNKINESFLSELNKFKAYKIFDPYKTNNSKNTINENIKVFTSEICGLGKSEEIKKIVKAKNKKYFHFPLGGTLFKNIIFDKVDKIIKKISKTNYKNSAIHLDLTESKENSVLNEFFFSFLITKFYSNNENIIYIPNNIEIYIEIPNCFEDYLLKFGILKSFNLTDITIQSRPNFNLPDKMINIFNRMLGYKSNEEIKNFIENKIGKNYENYSYHQVNIFIKLFIGQYNKFNSKLRFLKNKNDVTSECIDEFAKCTNYFTKGGFAKLLTGNGKNDGSKDYIDILSEVYDDDLHNIKFSDPLIFIVKEKMEYSKLYIPEKNSTEYKNSKDYLKKIKKILNIPNEVETDTQDKKSLLSIIEGKSNKDNYVITNDNFKKMVLLVYRIIANVPVIIMGETGCGKTTLITKLNQILNNGETTVKIINIHPGITDNYLCEQMKNIDKEAQKNPQQELWIFFDEINTCLSLSLLTEIFIKRTYNGEPFNENIRLIGACNPYRKRKADYEKCGLSRLEDDDNELVYLVQPLPQSLLYYVFSFGSIDENDEKKYINSILKSLFTDEEEILCENTADAISECHKYLRKIFDPSVVSLREMTRFKIFVGFFEKYYKIKNEYENEKKRDNNENIENIENNEKINKIISIICSIYLCYYIRLIDDTKRTNFEIEIRSTLLKLVNNEKNNNQELINGESGLFEKIVNEQLKNECIRRKINVKKFSDFLEAEELFLLEEIELNKGIGKNKLLKENLFLLFLSVVTNVPLIIIGKPGSGKSLCAQLISKSMRGKYSKSKFFQKFPSIIQTYFQGSESSKPEDIEKLFNMAKDKLEFYKNNNNNNQQNELPISMILFDELGLAEKSPTNPLKVLHSKLEYGGKIEGVSFVGISNYSLDAAKINRTLTLSVPSLDEKIDDLTNTAISIVESISTKLINDRRIFELLSKSYFYYKKILNKLKELMVYRKYRQLFSEKKKQFGDTVMSKEFKKLLKKETKIKVDFHGNRDFYNLIKGVALKLGKLSSLDSDKVVENIINCIERNFGGIEYEVYLDFDLNFTDINEIIKYIKDIVKNYNYEQNNEKPEKIKVSSVFLFKQIYNRECEKVNSDYKIEKENINKYDFNKCINDNIDDTDNRYLLLEIKPSLAPLIYHNIKMQNPNKEIILYEGSPFEDDNNNEFRFKKVNEIQEDARSEKLIILQNLNQIHPFLYDLYNMNYIIKDGKKFARICLDNFNEQLTLVNDLFRIIIMVDRKFIDKVDMAFLNRLEKMIIKFENLLDSDEKKLAKDIIEEIQLKECIDKVETNYTLSDLLINCGQEEIEGLIYNFYNEARKNNEKIDKDKIKKEIFTKIYNILPQDIIVNLKENNIIRKIYLDRKKYYSLNEYIKSDAKDYKISIIYTFTSITNTVEGIDNDMSFMVSGIKSENKLKNLIDEIKRMNTKEKNIYIFIHFEQSNSKKMKFIYNFIFNYFDNDKYRYIFIIHIKRNINSKKKDEDKTGGIYSVPDISPKVKQLFIDNLNSKDDNLNDILENKIKNIIDEKGVNLNLDKEFYKNLKIFLNDKKNKNKKEDENNNNVSDSEISSIDDNNYFSDIKKYFDEEKSFKEKIIDKAKDLIDENKEVEKNGKDIIKKIFENKYIKSNSLDICSCILDYIKEIIFSKFLKYLFEVLEDNNILTTFLEVKKNGDEYLKNSLNKIIEKYFETIIYEKKQYEPKFAFNYKILGFYNFYKNLSNYISKNITLKYFHNENKLRKLLKGDIKEEEKKFHENEEILLNNVNDEIRKNKFVVDTINIIQKPLLLEDYITYYLNKYNNNNINSKDDSNYKLIELLIKLRFKEKYEIIKNNLKNENYTLLAIIWLESNINYIFSVLKVCDYAQQIFNIFNNDKKKLYTTIEKIIDDKKIRYITNDLKNPEYTREVNECYYIFLASLCLCITSREIKLNDKNDITIYCSILKKINKILENLNNDLCIFLNEMYIIDELIKVIEVVEKNKEINIEDIKTIKNYFRKNAFILQKNQLDKIDELKLIFNKTYELINYKSDKK